MFTGLLLADEINRTPPKTQAALLEAMQERQVTVEGRTFLLPQPFHVLATANPVEYEGTYPLPEAQLDRFLLRVGFGYPTPAEEYDVLRTRIARQREQVVLDPVTDAAGLLEMQAAVEEVEVDRSVGEYCVALVAASRSHRDVLIGSSPRGSLALMMCARALAVISGRDFVLPEDVKKVAPAVLAHRITLKPELWMTDLSGQGWSPALLAAVPTPTAREAPKPGIAAMNEWRVPSLGACHRGRRSRHAGSRRPRAPGPAGARGAVRPPLRPGGRTRAAHRGQCPGAARRPLAARGPEHQAADLPSRRMTLEQVTVTLAVPAFVVPQPPTGSVAVTPRARPGPRHRVPGQPTPLGSAVDGTAMLAATSHWGGYRWGPQRLPEAQVVALPEARPFTSGETPHPVGLIGQNRSRRGGDGSEFFAIRPFQPGDRLRRVNWRTTLRTGEVHAVGTTAQEDSSVLLLLDAASDVGASAGWTARRAPSTWASARRARWRRTTSRSATASRCGSSAGPTRRSDPAPGSGTSDGCRSCSPRCSPAGRTCSGRGTSGSGPARARWSWSSRRCSHPRSPP